MPIYEYHCPNCNQEFEVMVRNSTKLECPKCGNRKLSKKNVCICRWRQPRK